MENSKSKKVFIAEKGTSNSDWWPNSLNLKILSQHSEKVSPFGKEFNYKKEFLSLDLDAIKED